MKTKFFILIFLFIISCTNNPLYIDVTKQTLTLSFSRFDNELFSIPPGNIERELPALRKKYPVFFDLFCNRIINIPAPDDSMLALYLKSFTEDKEIRETYNMLRENYASVKNMEEDLTLAFKHYRHYFPEKQVPEIITYHSGFNYSVVSADSILAVGLDMYLGEKCKFYTLMGYPKYKIRKMQKQYIVPDCMRGWLQSEFENKQSTQDFLSEMLYEGKLLYATDAMLPAMHDSLKTGFTAEQLEFCKNNEANIWAFFIENKLLFSTNRSDFRKFISDGPTTNGFPKESPAMLGCWMGWQIVKKYMLKNKEVTLQQLMEEKDARKILTNSGYKPQK